MNKCSDCIYCEYDSPHFYCMNPYCYLYRVVIEDEDAEDCGEYTEDVY